MEPVKIAAGMQFAESHKKNSDHNAVAVLLFIGCLKFCQFFATVGIASFVHAVGLSDAGSLQLQLVKHLRLARRDSVREREGKISGGVELVGHDRKPLRAGEVRRGQDQIRPIVRAARASEDEVRAAGLDAGNHRRSQQHHGNDAGCFQRVGVPNKARIERRQNYICETAGEIRRGEDFETVAVGQVSRAAVRDVERAVGGEPAGNFRGVVR